MAVVLILLLMINGLYLRARYLKYQEEYQTIHITEEREIVRMSEAPKFGMILFEADFYSISGISTDHAIYFGERKSDGSLVDRAEKTVYIPFNFSTSPNYLSFTVHFSPRVQVVEPSVKLKYLQQCFRLFFVAQSVMRALPPSGSLFEAIPLMRADSYHGNGDICVGNELQYHIGFQGLVKLDGTTSYTPVMSSPTKAYRVSTRPTYDPSDPRWRHDPFLPYRNASNETIHFVITVDPSLIATDQFMGEKYLLEIPMSKQYVTYDFLSLCSDLLSIINMSVTIFGFLFYYFPVAKRLLVFRCACGPCASSPEFDIGRHEATIDSHYYRTFHSDSNLRNRHVVPIDEKCDNQHYAVELTDVTGNSVVDSRHADQSMTRPLISAENTV